MTPEKKKIQKNSKKFKKIQKKFKKIQKKFKKNSKKIQKKFKKIIHLKELFFILRYLITTTPRFGQLTPKLNI